MRAGKGSGFRQQMKNHIKKNQIKSKGIRMCEKSYVWIRTHCVRMECLWSWWSRVLLTKLNNSDYNQYLTITTLTLITLNNTIEFVHLDDDVPSQVTPLVFRYNLKRIIYILFLVFLAEMIQYVFLSLCFHCTIRLLLYILNKFFSSLILHFHFTNRIKYV